MLAKPAPTEEIAGRLKILRLVMGQSQEAFCRPIGINAPVWDKYETAHRRISLMHCDCVPWPVLRSTGFIAERSWDLPGELAEDIRNASKSFISLTNVPIPKFAREYAASRCKLRNRNTSVAVQKSASFLPRVRDADF